MNDQWKSEIERAISDFIIVSRIAEEGIELEEIRVEFLDAPHTSPTSLPGGKMAVYGFGRNGSWLKIGKVGPQSKARYTNQHYAGSAMSTLAGSIFGDPDIPETDGMDKGRLAQWIRENTYRVNVLIPSDRSRELLSLMEAFFHVRLRPKYEG